MEKWTICESEISSKSVYVVAYYYGIFLTLRIKYNSKIQIFICGRTAFLCVIITVEMSMYYGRARRQFYVSTRGFLGVFSKKG
jgi:hypothetical protein